MKLGSIEDLTASPGGSERAYSISLVRCTGECFIHISLLREDGTAYADAPLNRETALDVAETLRKAALAS